MVQWLLALFAASIAAAVVLRLQTFLFVPWEAKMRGVETAYVMLADASYWSDAASSLAPLSLVTFVLSLPFAIAVSGIPEWRGKEPYVLRYAIFGGVCAVFWISLATAMYQSSESGSFSVVKVVEIAVRPELGFLVIAGIWGGYLFGRLRMTFR